MSFLGKLFGGGKPRAPEPPATRVADAVALVKSQARPCVRLVSGRGGRSRLGGAPEMSTQWPRFRGSPLSLVAQLDLEEIRDAGGPDWLPARGRLMFFYSLEYDTWGHGREDAGSAVVVHEVEATAPATEPADLPETNRFPAHPVQIASAVSYPEEVRAGVSESGFSRQESNALEAALEGLLPEEPCHQIGGYAGPIQGDDMEQECARIVGLKSQAKDWVLLLQVDTDPDADMSWGDSGRLYFWVRELDARAGDFSKVWVILQCC